VTLLLILLAGVWAVVLVPPYVRNRGSRASDSISSFHQQLRTLERARPGGLPRLGRTAAPLSMQPIAVRAQGGMPAGRSAARRRRRDILFTLGGAVVITFLLAVLLGGVAILCQLVADATLAGYVYLLVQMRKTEAERSAKVRYLHSVPDAEPRLALNRTASN